MRRLVWLLAVALISNRAMAQNLSKEDQIARRLLWRSSIDSWKPQLHFSTTASLVFDKGLALKRAVNITLSRLRPGDIVLSRKNTTLVSRIL